MDWIVAQMCVKPNLYILKQVLRAATVILEHVISDLFEHHSDSIRYQRSELTLYLLVVLMRSLLDLQLLSTRLQYSENVVKLALSWTVNAAPLFLLKAAITPSNLNTAEQ